MSEILVGIDTIRETRDPELRELERGRIDRRRHAENLSRTKRRLFWYVVAILLAVIVFAVWRNG